MTAQHMTAQQLIFFLGASALFFIAYCILMNWSAIWTKTKGCVSENFMRLMDRLFSVKD